VGKENLFKISMTQNEFDSLEDLPSDIEQNIYFMNFLEAYRLNKHLDKTLPDKKSLGKNKKI
jgi:hypothetical protein